jgi:hypothetical protein
MSIILNGIYLCKKRTFHTKKRHNNLTIKGLRGVVKIIINHSMLIKRKYFIWKNVKACNL